MFSGVNVISASSPRAVIRPRRPFESPLVLRAVEGQGADQVTRSLLDSARTALAAHFAVSLEIGSWHRTEIVSEPLRACTDPGRQGWMATPRTAPAVRPPTIHR